MLIQVKSVTKNINKADETLPKGLDIWHNKRNDNRRYTVYFINTLKPKAQYLKQYEDYAKALEFAEIVNSATGKLITPTYIIIADNLTKTIEKLNR